MRCKRSICCPSLRYSCSSLLQLLFSALEHQFKFEPCDRPLILQRIHILNNVLPNQPVLSVPMFIDLLKHLKEEGTHLTDIEDGLSQKHSKMRRSSSVSKSKTTYQHKSTASSVPTVTMSVGFLSSSMSMEEIGQSIGSLDQSNWQSWDATLDDYFHIVLKSTQFAKNAPDGRGNSQFVICAEAGETSQNAIKHQLITLLMQVRGSSKKPLC